MRVFSLSKIIYISIQNSDRIIISGKNEFILLGCFKLPVNLLCSFVWGYFICLYTVFKICSQVLLCTAFSDLTFHWSQIVIIPPRIKLGSMDLIHGLLKLESLQQALGQYLLQENRKSFCSQRPCVNRGCWEHFPAADSRCATWPRPSFMLGQDPMYISEVPPPPWVPWEENLDLLRVMLWSSQVPSLD